MSSESPFSGEFIRQSTEAVGSFLRWIAELIVSKNWFSLLIAMAIIGQVFLNPGAGLLFKFLNIPVENIPDWYRGAFWVAQAGLLSGALLIAVQSIPRKATVTAEDLTERRAIKGLRPFSREDAEVYAQLQRQQNLRECLESITNPTFRFGTLHGESGCGKTSFLQAGVLPQLSTETASHRAIYVRFSDQEPVQTIANAVAEQLEIPPDWLLPEGVQQGGLLMLLQKATEAVDRPLVLLFDQFEQFFVHYKRPEQRAPFVNALAAWYKKPALQSVTVVVSVRSDLWYQLDELYKALGHSLGPQDIFRLNKFTPSEAARILGVIASTEGLAFDRKFIAELAEEELADREDGLISPVDLQILAWMIERQTGAELRAFNRSAFQKFGGVEGLLNRFLDRTLEARVTTGQRQAALKVLLALTDLDRQVRAGVLTVPTLKAKLKGTAKPEEVDEAVAWLARSDVRLITPQEQPEQGSVGYELAHERLIPALLRQAGRELSAADRANRLLDRRVNEWLGNQCSRRYLFGLRELWQIDRQRPYLMWGAKREQKEKLLRLSRRRNYGIAAGVLAAAVVSTGFVGWLKLTPSGQIYQIRSQLSALLDDANDAMVADAAVAFAKNNQWEKAFGVTRKYIQADALSTPRDQGLAQFVSGTAEFLDRAEATENRLALLRKLQGFAESIQDDGSKSYALSAIASAYVELAEPAQAAEVLTAALSAAQNIQADRSKSDALSAIASAAVELAEPAQAAEVLTAALSAAQNIQADGSKSDALSAIASAYVELAEPAQAAEVLTAALSAAQNIQADGSKSDALSAIASAAVELAEPAQAAEVLTAALSAAQNIQDDGSKSDALSAIAAQTMALSDEALAREVLNEALQTARKERLSVPMVKIANFYAKQADWGRTLYALSTVEDREKTVGLSQVLTILAEHKNPKLIAGAIVLENGPNGIQHEGQSGNYRLTARIQSPDQNCEQRADWWEAITPEGALVNRQLIEAVHKTEQPFSSPPLTVNVQPDQALIVRAHFSDVYASGQDPLQDPRVSGGYYEKSGYTDQALRGSLAEGFKSVRISENFAKWLETEEPLPNPDTCID
ncbi:MAG: NACHT domain-containing protein [Leptolyngbya sp. SIO4C1]|nr:NACHT domain-containing protein [Leptolyngbya sp. SIO4C1]